MDEMCCSRPGAGARVCDLPSTAVERAPHAEGICAVGEIRVASTEERVAILGDINTGIQADQCACDLRNPQGSCCLGNVRRLIRRSGIATDPSGQSHDFGQAVQ